MGEEVIQSDSPNEQVPQGFIPPELAVADVLRLIGGGAGRQVLMALGQGPLRTKQLTERVPDFSARSVYRCVGLMSSYGLIDRYEGPGVPSTVLLRLSEPAGRNLFRLLRSFPSPSEEPLSLLGEQWEMGFFHELGQEPRSLIELAERPHGLTYHQVKRRTQLFMDAGLLDLCSPNGSDRQYELTDQARRRIALVTAIGRWRHRHVVAEGMPGLKPAEMAAVLRTVLPLIALPEHAGTGIDLVVAGDTDRYARRDTETVRGTVGYGEGNGGLRRSPVPSTVPPEFTSTSPVITAVVQLTRVVPPPCVREQGFAHVCPYDLRRGCEMAPCRICECRIVGRRGG